MELEKISYQDLVATLFRMGREYDDPCFAPDETLAQEIERKLTESEAVEQELLSRLAEADRLRTEISLMIEDWKCNVGNLFEPSEFIKELQSLLAPPPKETKPNGQ